MEDRAISGVLWTLLTYAGNKVVTLLTTVILAHLLAPSDFGLLALATIVILLINTLRELGLADALVLRQDLDARAKGTVLALLVITSVLLAVLMAAFAPVAAAIFNEPRLAGVVAVLSIAVVLGGFNSFYEAVMQRELEFRRRFAALAAQTVVYAAVAISLAVAGAGVWSLVAGQIAGSLAFAAALFALAPYRVRPVLDRGDAGDILRTGRGFMAQGLLAIVSQNVDYFSIGRQLGSGPLGFYSMGYRMAEVPFYGIADPVAKVTFPAFARMRKRGEDPLPSFLSVLRLVALVTCPLGIMLSAGADPFTRALFGERWLPMIGPLGVLGIWAMIRPVQVTVGWLLNSFGHADLMAKATAGILLPVIPAVYLAATHAGTTAVATVMLGNLVASGLLFTLFAQRRCGLAAAAQWRALRAVAAACLLEWVAVRAVADLTSGLPAGVALAACIAAGALVYLGTVSAIEPGTVARARRQILRIVSRAPSAGPTAATEIPV